MNRWREIAWCVNEAVGRNHVSLLSAGLAMYGLLAVFPGLAAAVCIYGLFVTPADVVRHFKIVSTLLPPGTWQLFSDQLQALARTRGGSLSASAVVALLLGLWGARLWMGALITASNITYPKDRERGFIHEILLSLLFTAAAIAGFLLAVTAGVLVPFVLEFLGTQQWMRYVIVLIQWAVLWVIAAGGLAVIYRFAPVRPPDWRWVRKGAGIAATLWLLISSLFALYVRTFAGYGSTYGALAGVIVLLMWFYLSSFTVVLGMQINAQLERRAGQDTANQEVRKAFGRV